MEQGTIAKTELGPWLASLAGDYQVFAPAAEDGGVYLRPLESDAVPVLDYVNTALPLKQFFFPQRETLCTFDQEGMAETVVPAEPFIVFGGRPCDARSLSALDRLFGADDTGIGDPYYAQRRANGLVIALACMQPSDSCFCASLGGGPAAGEGSDILVHPLDEALLFRAQTDKGRALMKAQAGHFAKADHKLTARAEKAAAGAAENMPALDLQGLSPGLTAAFEAPAWKTVSRTCLGCGTCTYICPTCHCFDITDETKGARGRRLRSWDSCQYPLFTQHASGHNPRPSPRERMRQRIMHKFAYAPANFNEVFCVGCGRCIRSCPVNFDIREAVTAVRGI